MINLLPPESAAAIRYGRQNTKLRRWLLGIWISVAGLAVILAGGWIYISQESKTYQKNIDTTNQQLSAQNLTKVQSDAKEISGDIKVINNILQNEIDFSQLIQTVGNVMPPGTVLSSLSLSNVVSGGIDLSANSVDSPSAAQIAVNLRDPKYNLFSKVDIVNISCDINKKSPYKCDASFRVLFSAAARTKFINVPKGSN
ncbi:MAG TPA: hypothetical protein VFP32_02975 [Candidatus Saccharimonadales bacterium]|nr:hypothetical protein [Candidatus Saccharimonadales bacterium]